MAKEKITNIEKKKAQEFTVRIGPKLREVLNQQKDNISEVTYACVNPSDLEAGEIIAKKVLGEV